MVQRIVSLTNVAADLSGLSFWVFPSNPQLCQNVIQLDCSQLPHGPAPTNSLTAAKYHCLCGSDQQKIEIKLICCSRQTLGSLNQEAAWKVLAGVLTIAVQVTPPEGRPGNKRAK